MAVVFAAAAEEEEEEGVVNISSLDFNDSWADDTDTDDADFVDGALGSSKSMAANAPKDKGIFTAVDWVVVVVDRDTFAGSSTGAVIVPKVILCTGGTGVIVGTLGSGEVSRLFWLLLLWLLVVFELFAAPFFDSVDLVDLVLLTVVVMAAALGSGEGLEGFVETEDGTDVVSLSCDRFTALA